MALKLGTAEEDARIQGSFCCGEMAERFKAVVLKTEQPDLGDLRFSA